MHWLPLHRRIVRHVAHLATPVKQHGRLVRSAGQRDVTGRWMKLPVVLPESSGQVDSRQRVGRVSHQTQQKDAVVTQESLQEQRYSLIFSLLRTSSPRFY